MLLEKGNTAMKEDFLLTKHGPFSTNNRNKMDQTSKNSDQNTILHPTFTSTSYNSVIPLPNVSATTNIASSCVTWGNITRTSFSKQNQMDFKRSNERHSCGSFPVESNVRFEVLTLPESKLYNHSSHSHWKQKAKQKVASNARIDFAKPCKQHVQFSETFVKSPTKNLPNLFKKRVNQHCHTSCGFHHSSVNQPRISVLASNFATTNLAAKSAGKEDTERSFLKSTIKKLACPYKSSTLICCGEEVNLPPSIASSRLEIVNRIESNSKTSNRRAFTSHSSREGKKSASCQKCSPKIPLSGNNLRERLSLIHFYGSAYENIALDRQKQEERRKAQMKQELKRAERIGKEKKKKDQRKKIYALNRLMTNLEQKNFEEFMKNKNSADEGFV